MKSIFNLSSFIKNPSNLMKVYTIFSLLSFALFLALVSYGIQKIYTEYNVSESIKNSIGIGKAIFENEKEILLSTDSQGTMTLHIDPRHFPQLDSRMVNYLAPLGLVKIKVFSKDKVITYSTDHGIIGKIDLDNIFLTRALKGEVVSKLVRKDDFMDLEGEQRFNIDVVETYFPVIDKKHGIVGAYEVYADISYYRAELREILRSSLTGIGLTLLVVFGSLFLLMRSGTKALTRAHESLENMAATDVLTGIANRRQLFARAEEEFLRVKRQLKGGAAVPSTGYLMVDIDYFKKINDTHGHLVGDEILRQLADRLKASTRKYDIVGRYGGEEFLIVLLNTNLQTTRGRAEILLDMIRGTPFQVGDSSYNITISIGISCLLENDEDINSAIKRADDGLYKAKNSGRDRVAWV